METIRANLACNQSARSTHLPGYVIRASRCYSRNPCRNGSNTPRSADRSRRVGPGRPAGCPRRTLGEARRRNLRSWLRAGLPRPSKNSGEGGYQGFRELLHPGLDRHSAAWYSVCRSSSSLPLVQARRLGPGWPLGGSLGLPCVPHGRGLQVWPSVPGSNSTCARLLT